MNCCIYERRCRNTDCMIKVCVCEDELRERKIIGRSCEEFFRKKGVTYDISMAGDAKEVLEIIEEIDLLVLDIELPGMDGITLKNRMQRNEQCMILFVTSHDEMMPDAFGMNVIGFVEKRNLSFKLSRYLNLVMNMMGRDIIIEGKYHSRDVMMIHSEREYCRLHFKDGMEILIRSSLKKMEEELKGADFVKIDRAWLIHLKYLEHMEKRAVYVAGKPISVSRGCREALYKAYEKYCERNARYC